MLARELSTHLEAWPAGSLRAATARVEQQTKTLGALEDEIAASVAARKALRHEDEALGREALQLGQDLRRVGMRVPELERLVADEDAAATRTQRITELAVEEAAWLDLEQTRRDEAKRERERAAEALQRELEARNAVVRLADEMGRVPLDHAPDVPDLATARRLAGELLDALRASFR